MRKHMGIGYMGIGGAMALVLLVMAAPASAQLGYGLKVGLNIANLNDLESIDSLDRLEHEAVTGFVGGAFIKLPMGPLKLQVEGLYSVKGAKGRVSNSLSSAEWETKLTYFEFPVLLKYEFPTPLLKPFVYGGASVAFLNKAEQRNKTINSDWNEVDITDDLNRADFGLVLGAGTEFLGFTVEGRYTHGLSDPIDSQRDEILMKKAKNRIWSVMVGFDFF
ncbi:hypothetical protein CSB20_00420 [bacterium DOLZORAL124_64_63]|nr:MAG: hypothetical protein CSB20_00420 [bacterium DOLZORAL124_64_63]